MRWPVMVMMVGLLFMTALVIVPFTFASIRYMVLRSKRPSWLRRRLAARSPHSGVGLGATVTEELHAFMNANKRVQIERRQVDLVLRDDVHGGAPPRMGVDLEAGKAVIRRRG